MPGARAPAASCAHGSGGMHTSIHSEFTGITRHPHAMVYGLWRALPGDRLSNAHIFFDCGAWKRVIP
jgi:hypothetical protein